MGARPIDSDRFTLYGRPGSGSSSVEATLVLAGLDHVVIDVDKADEAALARLRQLNPLGQVPTLVLPDGQVMTESAAILCYLAELNPDAELAPMPGEPGRAHFLRLMTFLSSSLYMSFLRFYYPDRYTADRDGAEAVRRAAAEQIGFEWRVFDGIFGEGPFVLGGSPSVADLYAAMLMDWTDERDAMFARHPRLRTIAAAIGADPRIAPVWARHGITAPQA